MGHGDLDVDTQSQTCKHEVGCEGAGADSCRGTDTKRSNVRVLLVLAVLSWRRHREVGRTGVGIRTFVVALSLKNVFTAVAPMARSTAVSTNLKYKRAPVPATGADGARECLPMLSTIADVRGCRRSESWWKAWRGLEWASTKILRLRRMSREWIS